MWIGSDKSSAHIKEELYKNKIKILWKPGYNSTFHEKPVKNTNNFCKVHLKILRLLW